MCHTQRFFFSSALAGREKRSQSAADSEWIANINIAFPPRPEGPEEEEEEGGYSPPPPPPPPPPPTGSGPHHHPRDHRDRRFPPHADLIPDAKFPEHYGFSVPPKPPATHPRYMAAWIDSLLSGPFLPPQLRTQKKKEQGKEQQQEEEEPEKEDTSKLLFFLERAWGHNHDLITELVVQGKWQHAVWIVRALLEPAFPYPDAVTQSVFEGAKYTSFGDTREAAEKKIRDDGRIPSPAISGRSGLWAVTDPKVKLDIERRRRGFGLVLGSLAGMILRAGEEVRPGKDRLGAEYTDLIPTARQILAYCHTAALVPEQLYALDRYPRLHMLRPRILASLADAVWRAREAMVAREAAELGIVGEHRGMEVPTARYAIAVWGSGTKDISARPTPARLAAAGRTPEQIRRIAWSPYAEREVWLELILTIIVEGGYGNVGVSIIKHITAMAARNVPGNTWAFADYLARHPGEYTAAAIAALRREPKSGTAQMRALDGHSLLPPPVTTHPLTLPDWILPAVADAVVDGTAEGRGLEPMFRTILSYARVLPMRRGTLLRLLRHPALIWSKNAELTEVAAGLMWEFGDKLKGADMFYSALDLHARADNVHGALRVWRTGITKTRTLRKVSNLSAGRLLSLLVKHRALGHAWSLLSHRSTPSDPSDPHSPREVLEPAIPPEAYKYPTLTPALLSLAVHSRKRKLYVTCAAQVDKSRREGRRITRETYTSLMNAHLAFGDVAAAKQVLLDMRADGVPPDDVNLGILLHHELARDLQAGYALAEAQSARGVLGRDAWVAVLDHAAASGDKERAEWALGKLGVCLRRGTGMETVVLNILLRGVARREGAARAMVLCARWHTRGAVGAEGRAVGDMLSLRTVLHSAVREIVGMERREREWRDEELVGMLEKGGAAGGRRRRKDARRREAEDVVKWCWEEMRNAGMEIVDVVKTVRKYLKMRGDRRENIL